MITIGICIKFSLLNYLKWLQVYIDGHYWSCFPPCSYEGREIRFANTDLPSEAMNREVAMVYPSAHGLRADFQPCRHLRDRKKRREGSSRLFGHPYETFFCSSISRAAWHARRRTSFRSASWEVAALPSATHRVSARFFPIVRLFAIPPSVAALRLIHAAGRLVFPAAFPRGGGAIRRGFENSKVSFFSLPYGVV